MTIQSSARWERAVGAVGVLSEFHCFRCVLGSQKNKNSLDGICCSGCKNPLFRLADYSLRLRRVLGPAENLVLYHGLCLQLLENAWALAGVFCAC